MSRVAFGRLLLDRFGDPDAALSQFESYVRRYPDGTLAEEARVGRAQSLGQLGRRADERGAWEDLITHHPESPHVGRARTRLDSLDAAE